MYGLCTGQAKASRGSCAYASVFRDRVYPGDGLGDRKRLGSRENIHRFCLVLLQVWGWRINPLHLVETNNKNPVTAGYIQSENYGGACA